MSMPEFPNRDIILTRDQAFNAILTSIAMEETALSHIINAEGEKIQSAIQHMDCKCRADLNMLLKFNESAANMIDTVSDLQIILKNKLRLVLKHIEQEHQPPPCPPKPCPPKPCPPKPCPPKPCTSTFTAVGDWLRGSTLKLKADVVCDNGVVLINEDCKSIISLPPNRQYHVMIDLRFINESMDPICIELTLQNGDAIVCVEKITRAGGKKYASLSEDFTLKTPESNKNSMLAIRLAAPKRLKITEACLFITEEIY